MSKYVKAELALKHTIIYTDETGRYFRFSGGAWAWRNHNPGNLVSQLQINKEKMDVVC